MKKLIEMMADAQFFLFVLGLLGVPFFNKIHELLTKCNPTVFSYACVILTYVVFYNLLHK